MTLRGQVSAMTMALLLAGATGHETRITLREVSAALAAASRDHPADLAHRDLSYLDLSDLHFSWADLQGANLYGADLSNVDLSRANLADANLDRTIIVGANFAGAEMPRVRMRGTVAYAGLDISVGDPPNFAGANLSGAWIT